MSNRLDRIADRFDGEFADPGATWRTLGREAEHPIVDAQGHAADIARIWPHLQAPGDLRPVFEGELLVGLVGPLFTYAAEVGHGTMEMISEPCADLHELASALEAAQERLVAATDREGLCVLGYGIQPATPPTPALMTPKPRYGELLQSIGDDWLSFTTTASDQIHVSVGRSGWIAATNLANVLTPVAVALLANSPVHSGSPSGWVSAREGTMKAIGVAQHRHGMPGRPTTDAVDFVRQQAEMALLLRWQDGRKVAGSGTFLEWLNDADDDPDEQWRGYLLHEHYIWHSARPRSAHSTLELRSACQQPPGETHASAALSAAIVLAAPALAELVDATFGAEAWPVMHAYHERVLRHGLKADEPAPGFIGEVLDRCDAALTARGRGEQVFLDPLRRRLRDRTSPAHDALRAFETGGVGALVAATRFS